MDRILVYLSCLLFYLSLSGCSNEDETQDTSEPSISSKDIITVTEGGMEKTYWKIITEQNTLYTPEELTTTIDLRDGYIAIQYYWPSLNPLNKKAELNSSESVILIGVDTQFEHDFRSVQDRVSNLGNPILITDKLGFYKYPPKGAETVFLVTKEFTEYPLNDDFLVRCSRQFCRGWSMWGENMRIHIDFKASLISELPAIVEHSYDSLQRWQTMDK